jgi:hypothetical protein
MACLFDERGHVNAHWADQTAAPAHIAAIEQQVLPVLELISGDLTLQTEESE